MFTSEDAHYSSSKLGAFMGLGAANIIGVKTDHRGKMIPSALEEAILKSQNDGAKPFLVVATCGKELYTYSHKIFSPCSMQLVSN